MFHRKQQVAASQGKNEAPRSAKAEQGGEGGAAMSATGERKKMTCAEFQEVLPYTFESGGGAGGVGNLKKCQPSFDLAQGLRPISPPAKLHLPLRQPCPTGRGRNPAPPPR